MTVTAILGAPCGYVGSACHQMLRNGAASALAPVRVPKTASPAVLRERACKKAVTPGTSAAVSLTISVWQFFPVILSCSAAMFQMPYGYQDGTGGPGDLRPPSRPSGEDPRLPSRRPACGPAGQRPCGPELIVCGGLSACG